MATQYDPIAKDASLNTTENPSRNLADVIAQSLAALISAMPATVLNNLADVVITLPTDGQTLKYDSVSQKWVNADDAGGHTIEGADGTSLSQEPTLQFADADASDDAVNEKTVVNVVRERTQAEYDDMSAEDKANGIIHITDANAKPLFDTQVRRSNGDGTVADALNNVTGYGTNANGTYYKFADGTLICTKAFSSPISISTPWGVLYESSSPISFGGWAHSFVSTPVASLTVVGDGLACVPELLSGVSATSAGNSYFFRPTSANGVLAVNLIAIGRWK